MKITLISPETHDRLKAIYEQYPALTFQNEGYQYIDKSKLTDIESDMFEQVEIILKKHIKHFIKFHNFKTRENGDIVLRFQYIWDPEDTHFQGVGYIKLDELLNGFTTEDAC